MKKLIVIHATNTPSDQMVTLEDIEDMNSRERYSDPMPYHYIVNIDGRIMKGKRDCELCGHCGKFSRDSISVAYAGGVNINDSDNMQHHGVETHCCASQRDISSNKFVATYEYENTLNEKQEAALRFIITQLTMRFPEAQVTGANTLLYPDDAPASNEPYFDVAQWWEAQP